MSLAQVLSCGVFLVFALAAESAPAASSVKLTGKESSAELLKLATITEAQAKAAALSYVKGKIIGIELESEHGGLVYSIDVRTDTGKVEVQIDAGNGAFLGVEQDGDEHDDSD